MVWKIIKKGLIIAVLSLLFFSSWFSFVWLSPKKGAVIETVFEVSRGETARDIAQALKEAGLIRNKWAFILGYRLFYAPKSLKAGEYIVRFPSSTKDVLDLITEGRVMLHPLTIPEGLTRLETADHLQSIFGIPAADFLCASKDTNHIADLDSKAQDLEGYLFPETYHLAKGFKAEDIVAAMIVQFREVFDALWQKRTQEMGLSVRETVILASLIEKESSVAEERRLVSAVFHNRLKKGMKLDCDPTIIYVLKREGRFRDRLLSRDLELDSPYNSYLYPGLPPGPIANPGRESLQAALEPAEVDYFFFVSKNDGTHHFSTNFREHQKAVLRYQKKR